MPLVRCKEVGLKILSPTAEKFHALKSLTFDLAPGERVGLIGESGAGKTLLSFLLAGLLQNDSKFEIDGDVTFSSGDKIFQLDSLHTSDLASYRRSQVGLIFQDPISALHPTRKCGSQIREACKMAGSSTDMQSIYDLMAEVGLDEAKRIHDAYPFQLSGGECQRVVIAIVLAKKPKLLIADEPTSSLDSVNEQLILQLLLKISIQYGIALLLVSHNSQLLLQYFQRFIVLKKGQLYADDIYSNLMSKNDSYLNALFSSFDFEYVDSVDNISTEIPEKKQLISLRNIDFSYPQKSFSWWRSGGRNFIFKNLNLTIYLGEIVGLFGDSGSGKSTIAKIIARLEPIDQGSIWLRDLQLNSIPINSQHPFRHDIQLITQDSFLSFNPAYTVGQAMHQAWTASGGSTEARENKIAESLAQVNLSSRLLDLSPNQLSGGQRQRIMIARAMFYNPKLLLCDESIAAVDMQNRRSILDLLKALVTSRNLSVLFISHDLAMVKYISNRILELRNGDLIEVSTRHD